MEIIKLTPATKDYIWGGTRLKSEYGINADTERVAEAWVLSCHKDGESVCTGGKYDGMTLMQVIEKEGKEILGKKGGSFDFFPILVKFIDAKNNLSVQVHPSDEYALKNEGQYGKTEMWYVLDAEEGAYLYYGFNKEITKEELKKSLEDGTVEEVLGKKNVKKGDCFFIKSGTVHAIGKGLMIAEIQQNSNLTYRLYDYGRLGADGKPRELHIEKALKVTDLSPAEKTENRADGVLAECKYFTAQHLVVNGENEIEVDGDSFVNAIFINGEGTIDGAAAKRGNSFFIPAGYGKVKFTGHAEVILSKV